jgi:glucose-1-phosphate thymidylyltransferase
LKVIIPVAGVGTRLRPHTLTTPKTLLPVAGKPILEHIIDQIAGFDIGELIFVTGPHHEQIQAFVTSHYDIPARFVPQEKLYGLGYAVHLGLTDIDEDALIILGDTIVEIDWSGLIAGGRNALAVQEVDNPSAFGVVETNGDRIVRLVEKPRNPPTNKAVVGVYYVRDSGLLLESTTELVRNGVTTHGEIQLTDAFELLLKKGAELYTFPTQAWYDCGRRETILATNRFLLGQASGDHSAEEGSEIRQPVYIADDVSIHSSRVGPYVSIGPGTVIENSEVEDSIIGRGCIIEDSAMSGSILGDFVSVRQFQGDLNLGEYSQVGA